LRSSYSLNLVSSPGERTYPQKLHTTPLSFRFKEFLPHFGHFMSLETSVLGLDNFVRLGCAGVGPGVLYRLAKDTENQGGRRYHAPRAGRAASLALDCLRASMQDRRAVHRLHHRPRPEVARAQLGGRQQVHPVAAPRCRRLQRGARREVGGPQEGASNQGDEEEREAPDAASGRPSGERVDRAV